MVTCNFKVYLMLLYSVYFTDGPDYIGGVYNVTFFPGASKANLFIPIIDDDIAEPDETFMAMLMIPEPAEGVEAGEDRKATVTIRNDDEDIVVSLDPEDYTVNENDGFAVITVKASKSSSEKYTVMINTQDGTATGEWMYNITYKTASMCVCRSLHSKHIN